MVKCKSCSEGRCEGKYEYRHKCDDSYNCTCTCQEESSTTFWKAAGSIGLGVAAFSGGVVLAVSTGGLGLVGLAAAAGGGALTGVGATAAIHPIAKHMSGERMTGEEYAKDMLIGGTVGAITGPIGAGGASATTSIASKVGTEGIKQGAVKLGCRTAVGAVSGATASAVAEGINVASNDDASFSVTNVLKGAALGAATGGASHITGSLTSSATPSLANSAVKVVGDTVSTVVIDGTTQYITEGEIDPKRIALNAGARAATSAGYEAVSNATYSAHGGKEVLKEKLGDKELLDANPNDKEEILNIKKELEQINFDEVEKQTRIATRCERATEEFHHKQNSLETKQQQFADIQKEIKNTVLEMKQNPSDITELKNTLSELQGRKETLFKQIKTEGRNLEKFTNKHMAQPDMIGDKNIHALNGKHIGQIAADLPDPSTNDGSRGLRRVIFDLKVNKDMSLRYKIAGVVENHDYANAPRHGEVKIPELNLSEPFILPKDTDEEKDKEKKE